MIVGFSLSLVYTVRLILTTILLCFWSIFFSSPSEHNGQSFGCLRWEFMWNAPYSSYFFAEKHFGCVEFLIISYMMRHCSTTLFHVKGLGFHKMMARQMKPKTQCKARKQNEEYPRIGLWIQFTPDAHWIQSPSSRSYMQCKPRTKLKIMYSL